MKKIVVACLLLCCSTCFAQRNNEWQILREWKSKNGKQTIKARFVGDIDNFYVFMKEDGKLIKIKTDDLYYLDVRWLQDTRKNALKKIYYRVQDTEVQEAATRQSNKQRQENIQSYKNLREQKIREANTLPVTPGDVEMATFNRIKTHMTQKQVFAIAGQPTEMLADSEIAGFRTTIYSWSATGPLEFGNFNITFQNGKVVSKAQFGLK